MAAVSTPAPTTGTQNAWTCPTCRHGSPDPRDEIAHLDAHRQLGQFFHEWEAAVANDRDRRPVRGRLAAVLGVLVAVVALAGGALFWSLGRPASNDRPVLRPPVTAPALPAASGAAPVAQPAAPVAQPAPEPAPAPPPPPAVAAAVPDPTPPAPATAVAPPVNPPAAPVAEPEPASFDSVPPLSPVPVPVGEPPAPGPPSAGQEQLLRLCLLEICVNVG